MTINDRQKVALVALIAYAVFLTVILFVPGFKDIGFLQGLTGLITALFVALEIFLLVPASPKVMAPIGLATAAAFYYFLLPQIIPFIFPPPDTKVVFGTIYYENTTEPVADVQIKIPETDQRAKTDQDGGFKILNVPKALLKFDANYGGRDYPSIQINADNKYSIIKRTPPVAKTQRILIGDDNWSEVKLNTCGTVKGEYKFTKLFVLSKEQIAIADGYDQLRLAVRIPPNLEFLSTNFVKPFPEKVKKNNTEEKNLREWIIPVDAQNVDLEVEFCLAAKEKIPESIKVEANYWFQKGSGT